MFHLNNKPTIIRNAITFKVHYLHAMKRDVIKLDLQPLMPDTIYVLPGCIFRKSYFAANVLRCLEPKAFEGLSSKLY